MISDDLREKFEEQQLTIQSVSDTTGLDRSFLSRLLSGKTPPRTRRGRRSADQDPRYQVLAEAVGLDPRDFITSVCEEQKTAFFSKEAEREPAAQGETPPRRERTSSAHRILARLASERLPDEPWDVKLMLVPLFQELIPRTRSHEARLSLLQHLREQGQNKLRLLVAAPSRRSNASGQVGGVEVVLDAGLGETFQMLGDSCIHAAGEDTMTGLEFAEVFYLLGTIAPEHVLETVQSVPVPS